jgi:hypothetical protein
MEQTLQRPDQPQKTPRSRACSSYASATSVACFESASQPCGDCDNDPTFPPRLNSVIARWVGHARRLKRGWMLGGTKTFVFRYQRQGRTARITLGNYPAVSLREAYELHAELTKRLRRGEDLRRVVIQSNGAVANGAEATQAAYTVGHLADEFLKRFIYRERKRPREAEQLLKVNVLNAWRDRPAAQITRRDAIVLLDQIVDRGSPVTANRVAALLSQMFRFGVERGILEASPLVALPRPCGTEKARKRMLTALEIRPLWQRLRRSGISPPLRIALKLILVTAQRPGEVAGTARAEFDLENRVWTIPPERSKNG